MRPRARRLPQHRKKRFLHDVIACVGTAHFCGEEVYGSLMTGIQP
jgi:hypothetical protein